jgi:hypothetical protein
MKTPTNTAKPSTDPILMAIDAHKTAYATYRALCRQAADDERIEKAATMDWQTFETLFRTMPTTLAGFAELFDYLGSDRWAPEDDETAEYPRSVLEWASDIFHKPGDEHEFPSAKEWCDMMATGLRRLVEAPAV